METIVKINALRGIITNVYADGNIFLVSEIFFRVQPDRREAEEIDTSYEC